MKQRRFFLFGAICLSLMLPLQGCSKSLSADPSSSAVESEESQVESQQTATTTSKPAEIVLPTFASLDDLSGEERDALSQAVSDVCHFSFDVTKDDPLMVIYQGIIGPGASSFWNIHSTGDSEEDYRLFVKEDGKDPLRLFQSYGAFSAKDVDWILTNLYNMKPTHDSEVFENVLYYYENFYYVQWLETGYDPHEVKLLSLKSTNSHTYEVSYEIYDATDAEFLMITGTLTLKYQAVEEIPRWTYLQSVMQYEGYEEDEAIGEGVTNPNPPA